MRKLYFIASIPATAKDGIITGVVANGTGRAASHEEVGQLIAVLRGKGATPSLLESMRDETYSPVSAFERRADARAEAASLNSCGSCFSWHVIELGDSVRKPVRTTLGWRILTGSSPSAFNDTPEASVIVDHADRFSGDLDANRLFPTRDAGREVMQKFDLCADNGYTLVPVYADA